MPLGFCHDFLHTGSASPGGRGQQGLPVKTETFFCFHQRAKKKKIITYS